MAGSRFATSLLVLLLAPLVAVALERPQSLVPRTLKAMTSDLKSRIEALRMERELSLYATTSVMDKAMSNSTELYVTSVECTMCDDTAVGVDKRIIDTPEQGSNSLFSDVLNALAAFLKGGEETGEGGASFVVGILNGVSDFLGGEDTFLGGVLAVLADMLDPGAADIDSFPFITLLKNVLDALNPLSSNAESVVTADDTSDFKAAAFDLVGTVVDAVTALLSGIVTIDVEDKNGLATFVIGVLSVVLDIGMFGIGTVIETTGRLLAIEEKSTIFSADAVNSTSEAFRAMSTVKVQNVMHIYAKINDDIDGDNATAILASSEKALMGFKPKVDAFLLAADAARANNPKEILFRQNFITDLVTLITETLNGIMFLISGLVTGVIELLSGLAAQVIEVIVQLIDTILLAIAQIINTILGFFGLNEVPVSNKTLKELAVTVVQLESPLTLSEIAACKAGLDTCPEGVTDEDVACQVTYFKCLSSLN